MNTQFRFIGCISYFTLLAPFVGTMLFWLYTLPEMHQAKLILPWRELIYSVFEFWRPALLGGILFAFAAFPIGTHHRQFMKTRISRMLVSGLAFFCIFGVLIAKSRQPNSKELKATRVLEIRITSASAKIADTPPQDEPEDYDTDYWAGTVPVKMVYEYPIADEKLKKSIEIPSHVLDFYERKKIDG